MERTKFGDDFNVGDIYTTGRITVTEAHLVNWAGVCDIADKNAFDSFMAPETKHPEHERGQYGVDRSLQGFHLRLHERVGRTLMTYNT